MRITWLALLIAVLGALAVDITGCSRIRRPSREGRSGETHPSETVLSDDLTMLDELGSRYLQLGDCDAAIHYWSKIIELAPGTKQSLEAKLRMAGCYSRKHEYAQAAELYRDVLNINKKISHPELESGAGGGWFGRSSLSAEALAGLSGVSENRDELRRQILVEYPETRAALRICNVIAKDRAATTGATRSAELVSMARDFAKDGETKQAALALYAAGLAANKRQDMEHAVELWTKVVADYPDTLWAAEAQLGIGLDVYLQQGEWAKALDALQKRIDDYPDNPVWMAEASTRMLRQFLEFEKKYPR